MGSLITSVKRTDNEPSPDTKSSSLLLPHSPILFNKYLFTFVRRILKIFWPVQISNQELWVRAKQRPIELEIRQRKWGWLGHTLRRPPGDIAKAALEWNPQGTTPRGRPRTTCRGTILEDIRHQGKTWKEVKVLARNRVRWWSFVRAPCTPEEWWETIYIYSLSLGFGVQNFSWNLKAPETSRRDCTYFSSPNGLTTWLIQHKIS